MRLIVAAALAVGCSKAKSLAPTVEQATALMAKLGIPCEDRHDAWKCDSPEGMARGHGFVMLDGADHSKVTSLDITVQDPAALSLLAPVLPAGAMEGITQRITAPTGKSFTIDKVEITAGKSGDLVHVQIDYWDR